MSLYLDVYAWKHTRVGDLAVYNAHDGVYTARLYTRLRDILVERHQMGFFTDHVMPLLREVIIPLNTTGVVLDELNGYLAKWGRKIGPDPSSANRAVIGGVVANNATGSHSLQFGYIADYVERIQVVLPNGEIVEFTNDFAST